MVVVTTPAAPSLFSGGGQRSAGEEREVAGVHDEAGVQVEALLVKVELLAG